MSPKFPHTRMRRNRKEDWTRRLVRESSVSPNDLIWPTFVVEGSGIREEVPSMPGVCRLSMDVLVKEAQKAKALGIPAIAIFPVVDPSLKSAKGEEAFNPDNLLCRTVTAIKSKVDNLGLICDVALDPYTSHGHDGILKDDQVQNDETVDILCKQALVQARAGCDIIAPSDMMDGRVGAIRQALDGDQFQSVQILAYAAKYASHFYGPFRDAVGSKNSLGGADKRTYQQDPANTDEALREVALDIEEGADMVMIKPGMPYLDVLYRVKQAFHIPTFVYQVSGEYAMLHAASAQGWLSLDEVMMESLLCFKRAGADGVLTYSALDVAEKLQK